MNDSQFFNAVVIMIVFVFSCVIAGLVFYLGFQLIEFFIEKLRDWDYEKNYKDKK